jgi:methylaspartate mutase epsilon subunit
VISNRKLGDEFWDQRKEVLAQWPTGRDVDFDEAIGFQKGLPAAKVWTTRMGEAERKGETLIITGMGKATLEQQIDLLRAIEPVADVLGTSVDSLTRNHDFKAAGLGIERSRATGTSVLNGFPIVNHGVAGMRKLVEAISIPIRLKFGAPDTRIILEIAFAGGITADSGDSLYNFWNMNAREPLETVLKHGQYVHRLVGAYEEHGVGIGLTVLGMYGAGIPPGLVIAAAITQVLMMAEQGVRHINLHYMAQGNLAQDVAAAGTFRSLAREYLQIFGHDGVHLTMSAGLGLAQYPDDPACSFIVTSFDCLLARLCGAQVVDVRTIAEAKTIPTEEDICATYRAARMAARLLRQQHLEVNRDLLSREAELLELEIRSILSTILELGDGDVAVGVTRAVPQGVLDNPFSCHRAVASRVMGVRDDVGAMRYLDPGNLPLPDEVLQFHKEKIKKREELGGRKTGYETVVEDLMSISRGYLVDTG